MKNRISVLLISLMLFSSCGVFKSTKKVEDKQEARVETKLDSQVTQKSNTVDKTETVIKEKAKGTVYTKPVEVKAEASVTDLLSGMKVIVDSGLVKITQSYDSVRKVIVTQADIKPQAVTYDVDKITTVKNDITSQVDAKAVLKKDSTSKVMVQRKTTTSKPSFLIWVVTGLLIVALVVGVLYYKKKRGL